MPHPADVIRSECDYYHYAVSQGPLEKFVFSAAVAAVVAPVENHSTAPGGVDESDTRVSVGHNWRQFGVSGRHEKARKWLPLPVR